MERIKRVLARRAPFAGTAQEVVVLGLPPAADVEGQLRLEGLESLLASRGLVARCGLRGRGTAAAFPLDAVWLGDAPEEVSALRDRPPGRLLLWPRPERVAETRAVIAGWQGPPPILCLPCNRAKAAFSGTELVRTCVLPDPAHALWGLLDHHPPGEGEMRLPPGDWGGELPSARVAALRWCGRPGARPLLGAVAGRVARRWLLEAARRRVAAHAVLSGTSVSGSILAALLGRGFRVAPAAGLEGAARIAAYWAEWRSAMVAR